MPKTTSMAWLASGKSFAVNLAVCSPRIRCQLRRRSEASIRPLIRPTTATPSSVGCPGWCLLRMPVAFRAWSHATAVFWMSVAGTAQRWSHYGDLGFTRLAGLEINPAAAQRAKELGFDVRCAELLDSDFSDASFDLIRMGHVIEHVLDPVATLRRAYRLLKPGGILMGETPNADCLDFRIFKKYWGALHIPRHIFIFNDRNLRQALESCSFARAEMSYGLRTVGWSAGVQNLLVDRAGLSVPPSGRSIVVQSFDRALPAIHVGASRVRENRYSRLPGTEALSSVSGACAANCHVRRASA